MDFFNGLDNSRYMKFKAEIENDRSKGTKGPQTLNDMFHRANTYVVAKNSWKLHAGAAFATRADDTRGGKGSGGRGRGGSAVEAVVASQTLRQPRSPTPSIRPRKRRNPRR